MEKQLPSYIQRMDKEYVDLSEKVKKLNEFIECREAFSPLCEDRQHLLLEQLRHMEMYQSTLNERIILEKKSIA